MNKNELLSILFEKLKSRGLHDEKHIDRLQLEWKEIKSKEWKYFAELYEQNIKYPENENNLIIPYLLDIVQNFNINKEPKYSYGDWPDIDTDYHDAVRSYLKEVFAKKQFGEEYVCNICNYNTFGMRSALIDMARVFGLDHNEIKAITKRLKDKDEDGKPISFDEAIELFDDLKAYCERNPKVADAAKRLMNRNRSLGQHASGLIVSRVPIRNFIPLVRGKEGSPASAWIEGLHGTDLSTVGFVKFDFLGLDCNQKIATAAKLACQSKYEALAQLNRSMQDPMQLAVDVISSAVGEMTVCALPGLQENGKPHPSWSDTSYLNDPKCMDMASQGDLRMVFQFDGSPGIRHLAKSIGVNTFDDLVATTALYRPGPMKLGAHEQYARRKNHKEEYKVHPLLADGPANLSFTHGILCYQEQVSRILNTVGGVPWSDCEIIRKAISKKQIDKFIKYKEKFIEKGQIILGESQAYLEHLFDLVEAFAGYGFNMAHAVSYTYLSSRMLWLKAHLPKPFFASMFTHTKTAGPADYQKLKEYKREAEKHGVKMMCLNINKSKHDFTIQGDKVYYGFCKIKNIGEEPARKLESLQPYSSFEDLLHRFGTDAKTIQAIIALKCFKDDPITLYKFYEAYKDFDKKEDSRIKRFHTNKAKLIESISALEYQLSGLLAKDRDTRNVEMLEGGLDPEVDDDGEDFLVNEITTLKRKLELCIANKEKRDQFVEYPTLANFNPDHKLNEEFMEILSDPTGEKAEIEFYGYVWQHPLERCPDYIGYTMEDFINSGEPDGLIEVVIRSVTEKKGPHSTYYSLSIEDATGHKRKTTVWADDMSRFEDELKAGYMVQLHVDAPKPPYPTFTLHQFPGSRWRKPRRESDSRVILLN